MENLKLFFISTITALMVLSGCTGIDDAFQNEPDLEAKTGILTELTSDMDFKGTHLLIEEDGTETPLRSLVLNLSGSNYLGNKVEIIGLSHEEDGVYEITGITVLEKMNSEIDGKKFIEYKNTDLGFKLKYYDNWSISEGETQIVFYSPEESDQDKVVIKQHLFATSMIDEESKPLETYVSQEYSNIEDFESLHRKVGPSELDAIELESDDTLNYYLYRPGLIYDVSFEVVGDDTDKEVHLRDFNEMLSEFNFLGFTAEDVPELGEEPGEMDLSEDDVEDLEVVDLPQFNEDMNFFESLPYEFRASYPADWYYAGSSSSEDGVLYHYGLSDESVEEENELVKLDIISSDLPSGTAFKLGDNAAVKQSTGSVLSIYISVDGQNYRISGNDGYEDLIMNIASSISHVEAN